MVVPKLAIVDRRNKMTSEIYYFLFTFKDIFWHVAWMVASQSGALNLDWMSRLRRGEEHSLCSLEDTW